MPAERLYVDGLHAQGKRTGSRERRGWVHAHGPALVQVLRLADVAWIVLSLRIAVHLFQLNWTRERLLLALLGAASFMFAASVVVLYRSWRAAPLAAELGRVLVCCASAVFLVTVPVSQWGPGPAWAMEVILAWGAIAFTAIAASRVAVRLGLRAWRARGRNFRTAVIVGATRAAQQLIDELRRNRWMGIRVAGVFDHPREGRMPITGDFDKLKRLVHAGRVDIVYVALPLHEESRIREIVQELRDSTVSVCFVAD